MIVYLAGPMSNYPDHNYPAFHAAEKALRAAGHDVYSPAAIGQHEGWEHHDYMRRALKLLLQCDAIYLLPGWQDSLGAQHEFDTSRILKMDVVTL